MKIWIDGYEANVPQRLGSSQVAYELVKNLEKIDKKNDYTVVLPSDPLEDLPKERKGWKYLVLKRNKFWIFFALPLALLQTKEKPDLIFSPTHYIPRFTNIKRIATIFDLSYLHFPKMFLKKDLWKLTNWSKYSILNSAEIITISNSTKQDIVKNYQDPKNEVLYPSRLRDKITVAYPGYNNALYKPVKDENRIKQVKKKYNIEGSYVIFIGTIQPRKNIAKLIQSFRKIENLKLVITGKATGEGRQGWMYEDIMKLSAELGIEDRVIFTDYVPDEDMAYLLNGAKVFILPSLWEGFGIPVVEAMACGLPVIVSNTSALPEIVGKAGLLVNPYSIDEIEQAIRTIASDNKLWKKKSQESLAQAKKFSWEKMAKTVLKVLENN